MRVIQQPGELDKALKTAQREAEAAFGVGDVYIEKYLENPRHIEFQVLGDHHGRGRSSRRARMLHSAPPPEAARGSAVGGGHREDAPEAREHGRRRRARGPVHERRHVRVPARRQGNFYFLEVNTRIQVEHPVTEIITGIDIVKEQIRIAAGERLSFKQGDVTFTGHAIECRVNAEDPVTFAPSRE